ncbi:MAG: PilW family protein, partial [Gammaproteobacteria bacterium]
MNVLRRQHGMSLIELMVALVIGSILIIGAVSVYMQSRSSYRVNEAVARLQENARFALDTMEPDIRLARYWGQTSRTAFIEGRATPLEGAAFAVGGDCTVNWSVNLDSNIEGANNAFPLWGTCASAFSGNPADDADVLVVRHAGADPVAPAAGRIQVQSDRAHGQLFADGVEPSGFATTSETFNLVAHGYYISKDSTGAAGRPSLRRKALTGGPAVTDEEIIPGVEDLQVQFGVDTDIDGVANRYVNPDYALVGTDN